MSDNPTIIRAKRSSESPYFASRRATAQDENLSFEARGMLWYLLSKPDDWEVQIDDLKQQCGRNKVYSIIKELQQHGYISERFRIKKADGRWEWTPYKVYEEPIRESSRNTGVDATPLTMSPKPEHGKPYMESGDILHIREDKQERQTTTTPAAPVQQKAVVAEQPEKPVSIEIVKAMAKIVLARFGYSKTTPDKVTAKIISQVDVLYQQGCAPETLVLHLDNYFSWAKNPNVTTMVNKWPEFAANLKRDQLTRRTRPFDPEQVEREMRHYTPKPSAFRVIENGRFLGMATTAQEADALRAAMPS